MSGESGVPGAQRNTRVRDFPDGFHKVVETVGRHKLLAERYVDGDVAIHLHLWLRPRHGLELPAQDLCAVYERLVVDQFGFADELNVVAPDLEVGRPGVAARTREDRTVPVGVGELVVTSTVLLYPSANGKPAWPARTSARNGKCPCPPSNW